MGYLTGALFPIGDELENLVVLFGFLQLPISVAKDPGVGIVCQEASMPFCRRLRLERNAFGRGHPRRERNGMEVEIEGDAMRQAQCARGIVPQAHDTG